MGYHEYIDLSLMSKIGGCALCILKHAAVPCNMQPHLDVNWRCILYMCYPYLPCGRALLLFLVLLKEIRMPVNPRFYLFCFWCQSRECGGPVGPRFPCGVAQFILFYFYLIRYLQSIKVRRSQTNLH